MKRTKSLCKSKRERTQMRKRKEILSQETKGDRVAISGIGQQLGRINVQHTSVLPQRPHHECTEIGLEKKSRESLKRSHDEEKKPRRRSKKQHSFIAKRTLHGETKASSSRLLPRYLVPPSLLFGSVLVQKTPLSSFNFVHLVLILRSSDRTVLLSSSLFISLSSSLFLSLSSTSHLLRFFFFIRGLFVLPFQYLAFYLLTCLGLTSSLHGALSARPYRRGLARSIFHSRHRY